MNERRPAILRKRHLCSDMDNGGVEFKYSYEEAAERVLVWPSQMSGGRFAVEHEDGTCSFAALDELAFLDSSSEFGKYEWPEMK